MDISNIVLTCLEKASHLVQKTRDIIHYIKYPGDKEYQNIYDQLVRDQSEFKFTLGNVYPLTSNRLRTTLALYDGHPTKRDNRRDLFEINYSAGQMSSQKKAKILNLVNENVKLSISIEYRLENSEDFILRRPSSP